MWNLGYRCDPGQLPTLTFQGETVLTGRLDSKMPSFSKDDIFRLMITSHKENPKKWTVSSLHVNTPQQLLQLWHRRMAHVEIPRLVNQERRMLTTGMHLPREALMTKHVDAANCPCKSCRLSMTRRHSFKGDDSMYKAITIPGTVIVADWHPFVNCPSRNGYFGV
jgi:hypothetical protein